MEDQPKRWSLNETALNLLLTQLDPTDRERAAEKYELLRHKLIKFFEWRGTGSPQELPDQLADETLDRVARRLESAQDNAPESSDSVSSYAYGVARMILLEQNRLRQSRTHVSLESTSEMAAPDEETPDTLAACFESCLAALPFDQRELVIEYYQREKIAKIEGRKELAVRLNIPLNALRIRACRIRATLEQCVRKCTAKENC